MNIKKTIAAVAFSAVAATAGAAGIAGADPGLIGGTGSAGGFQKPAPGTREEHGFLLPHECQQRLSSAINSGARYAVCINDVHDYQKLVIIW
jgi:hypothetical protein